MCEISVPSTGCWRRASSGLGCSSSPNWPTCRTRSSGQSPTCSDPASRSAPGRSSPRPARRLARRLPSPCSRRCPQGPHGSGPPWLTVLLLAAPYLAGAVGGLLVVRIAPTMVLEAAPIRGFCSGALAGVVLGVLAAFAGGPLGDGRMAAVGPSAWQVTVVAALEIGIAAAVTAGLANWRYVRVHWSAVETSRFGDPDGRPDGADRGHDLAPHQPAPGQDSPHTIYLDRWAGDKAANSPPRRSGGPSVLP